MNKPIIIAISLLLAFWGGTVRSEAQQPGQDEVQVLIDVSGSMKQSDPKNLRVEAGKLLINLLPEQSKAAIWLFAEKTVDLTASESVDAAWKKQALKAASRIHSQGLYTNIEDAIQTVLNAGFKGEGRKHLILLTDGVVDISKDIMVSADSRERILSELIPVLQQANIQVETIALSDQADKELLDKLAFDTGGWTETAESADQLQRVFLKMMQKAVPKDTLPLTDNRFAVDGGVKEFSVLAFKKPDSAPSQLLTPAQKKINKQTISPEISWLENPAYDLITVKNPGVGDWRLDAETDPDNQVMIVTDLKMQLDDLPNFVAEKEAVALKIHFTDRGKLIDRADFLKMITVTVELDRQAPVNMPQASGEPGYFVLSFGDLSPGKHQFKIIADGKTFKREILKDIEVVVAPIEVDGIAVPDKREVTLKMIPDPAVLDVATLSVEAVISRAGKPPETQSVEAKEGVWAITLGALAAGSETTVNFNATAKTREGKAISPAIKPIKIDDEFFRENAEEEGVESEAAEKPASAEDSTPSEQPAETQEASPPAATNWLLVGGSVLGVNLLLFAGGFFIYRAMKKANAEKQQQLLGRLS